MTMKSNNENALLSIGGLAVASGIPVETLRNWERRYGFPSPDRLRSGHRRYPLEIVPRLRQIRRALELGYKPSFAVPASVEELARVNNCPFAEDVARASSPLVAAPEEEVARWLGHVVRMDAARLEGDLLRAWTIYGARRFVLSLALPFLREVGDRWFDGRHTVAHEHLASETLQSFLAGQWRPLSEQARGPRAVLANLEGELHSLGIHMAAVFMVMHDLQPVFLGPNTPLDSIVEAARQAGVVAVIIGLAASSDVRRSIERLEELRRRLPDELVAAVGGNESVAAARGVVHIPTFDEFDEWLGELKTPGA